MAAADLFTDIAIYGRVPPAGTGVCIVCHSGPNSGFPTCSSCYKTTSQVSYPAAAIIPIALYKVPGQYWDVLRNYKDDRRPETRARHGRTVSATIARFSRHHWSCISIALDGLPEIVTTVPSTRSIPRQGEHPLAVAVKQVATLARLYRPSLARGPGEVDRQRACDTAFTVTSNVRDARILLIDDTFTTGARTQSAASALRLAGAARVVVLTAGRVIKPDWNDNCATIWAYATAAPFTFDNCCLCTPRVVSDDIKA